MVSLTVDSLTDQDDEDRGLFFPNSNDSIVESDSFIFDWSESTDSDSVVDKTECTQ